jgi:hypothetical protein
VPRNAGTVEAKNYAGISYVSATRK